MSTSKRSKKIGAVSLIAVLSLSLMLLIGCPSSTPQNVTSKSGDEHSKAESSSDNAALSARVNEVLQLLAGNVATLNVGHRRGEAITPVVPIEGELYTLDLQPQSVRASNYQIKVQLADGSYVDVDPGPVRTLRGRVVGIENSAVAASLEEDGLHARIFFPNDEQYWVEPLASKIPSAAADQYVVYRNSDIIAPDKRCALDDMLDPLGDRGVLGQVRRAQGSACGTGLCVAELAVDADYEYYLDYGSVAAVEAQVNLVINAANVQYERDVDITHLITTIIVRTAEPDPYSFTDATQLLFQFRDHWLAHHGSIQRDLAQLFTGKELNSNTIGIAWLNGVCNSYGFSVVQSDCCGSFGCTTDLSTHELGHNWGANHCSCSSYTMNSYLTCSNQFHPTFSIPEIVSFRDSRGCLDGVSECAVDIDCDDGDTCTTDTCDNGLCSNTPIDCDDGDACTTDSCDPASGCVHVDNSASCDDGNPCTTDSCDPATGCVNDPIANCCGNGLCESGEDCNTCPNDCISGGGSCGDGICAGGVEDCDTCSADCRCSGGPTCRNGCCGDGVCDGSENANNCATDCDPGFVPPSGGSCCGDGICEGSEDSFNCEIDCGSPPVCNDGSCDPGEDQCNCPADCGGTPPSTETNCTDGVDNDCDGLTDCADSDCSGDPACDCLPGGSSCSDDIDCCSGKCRGGGTSGPTCKGNGG